MNDKRMEWKRWRSISGKLVACVPGPTADAISCAALPLRRQRSCLSTRKELSPNKKIRTISYNGQIPGKLLRLTEGKPVTIEIVNRLGRTEVVH